MGISIEMSMYPLKEEYKPIILDFIARLRTYSDLTVITNNMSTRVFGDYDIVMPIVTAEMKRSLATPDTVVIVMKLIGKNLND